MVHFTTFAVSALLACSTVLSAPLLNRSHKASSIDVPLVNTTGVVTLSNVTSITNSTVSLTNGTLTDSGLINGTDTTTSNTTTALCDSGLTGNSTLKAAHHKGAAKGKASTATDKKGDAKQNAKAKGGHHHHKGSNTTPASGLPPCSSLVNSTTATIDNSTAVDNTTSVDLNSTSTTSLTNTTALSGTSIALTGTAAEGKKGVGKVRAFVRSLSRTPKRRLTPVPLWDTEDD